MFSFRLIRRIGYSAALFGFALCLVHLSATKAQETIGTITGNEPAAISPSGGFDILDNVGTSSAPADLTTASPVPVVGVNDGFDPLAGVRDAIGENIEEPFWTLGEALSGD